MHIFNNILTNIFSSLGYAVIIVLSGCVTTLPYPDENLQTLQQTNTLVNACRKALSIIDNTTYKYNRVDAGEQKLDYFPYLRTNRFLAALSDVELSASQQQELIELLKQTGRTALNIEVQNLTPDQRQQLMLDIRPWFTGKRPEEIIDQCSDDLAKTELQSQTVANYIQSQLKVDDHYNTWQRVIGLYYLTRYPVLSGVRNWHEEALAVFTTPTTELPVAGTLQRYTLETNQKLLTAQQTASILGNSRNNPLSIPLPSDTELQLLINQFAPVFEVDIASDDDRIGTPYWPSSNATTPDINIDKPVIYTKLSHVIFNNEVLLQLNYMIWLPSRPCQSSFDILCGHIDGVIWRVTLTNDGTPLLFDSIHSCGCYHQYFPTPSLKLRDDQIGLQEPVLVPRIMPGLAHDERVLIRLASISHYINAVSIETAAGITGLNSITVPQQNYDSLRSIAIDSEQHRSMFNSSGLVPGTQRPERFVLWPMGVPSPGAMRQWGTHATAFVGRRHFDEPCLLEEIFTTNTEKNSGERDNTEISKNIYAGICSKPAQTPPFQDN